MSKDALAKLFSEYEEYLSLGSEDKEHHYFPSGILALNSAIGDIRGIRGGTIVQLIGQPGHGKSTLALDFIAQAQQTNITSINLPNGSTINTVYADFERTFDKSYAQELGVDVDKVLVIKTPFAEQTFNIVEELMAAGIQMVIIDSIPMIIPKSEQDKSFDDNEKVASQAQVLGRFAKRAIQLADNADALVVFINQYRANLSPVAHTERKPYGAWLIRHAIRVSIELTKIKTEADRIKIKAFIEKTKLGATGRVIEYDMINGKGPDYNGHLLTLALEYDIIQRRGGWYSCGDLKAQGLDSAAKTFPLELIRAQVIKEIQQNV